MKTFVCLAALGIVLQTFAEPIIPANDQVVLEKLPRNFKPLQRTNDLATSATRARDFIQLARQTGEPRYLGYAQGAINPFLSQPEIPAEILALRAILRQSNHQFDEALLDLDALLLKSPRNKSALISKIAVLQAQGRISEARQLCHQAPWIAGDLLGLTALTSITSLNGQLASSIRLLRNAIDREGVNSWALTTLAEMHVRAGHTNAAEETFRAALQTNPDDIYLVTSYADFLLEQNRFAEVEALIRDRTNADGLLLRLTLATKTPARIKELQQRFNSARATVGNLHAREEAIFALHLSKNPDLALSLATENWQKQREPLDARILLECAIANRDSKAAQPVLDWLDANKVEDVRLTSLRSKL